MVSYVEVVVGFAAVLTVYSIVRYLGGAHNNLVEARHRVDRTWGDVEVLLQRRYDEVGDLIDLAREHSEIEQEILAELITARERLVEAETRRDRARADAVVREAVDEIYALSAEYPELRSHEHFADVRETISDLEQRLEDRREYYNEAVARYNVRLDRLPEKAFAPILGYEREHPFSAADEAREGIDVRERFAD